MTTPYEVLTYLFPFVATAGAYSAQIQDRVGTHAAKDGETLFHHALSDADLTIQSFLEVALLRRYPHLSFFSEEQEHSLNAKYFVPDAELEVLLDPVDGTRSYIDNREHYQIIVTIHDRSEIVGALCYMPRRQRCYYASKGQGAFVLSQQEFEQGASGRRLTLAQREGPVLLFNAPDLQAKLSPYMSIKDLITTYSSEPGRYNSTDLIEGLALATLHRPCQAIDAGAIGFIADEAGAIVTDFKGQAPGSYRGSAKRMVPNVVVAATPEIHTLIIKILASVD